MATESTLNPQQLTSGVILAESLTLSEPNFLHLLDVNSSSHTQLQLLCTRRREAPKPLKPGWLLAFSSPPWHPRVLGGCDAGGGAQLLDSDLHSLLLLPLTSCVTTLGK